MVWLKKIATNWRGIRNGMLLKILGKIQKYIKKNVINMTWDEYSTPFGTEKSLKQCLIATLGQIRLRKV